MCIRTAYRTVIKKTAATVTLLSSLGFIIDKMKSWQLL